MRKTFAGCLKVVLSCLALTALLALVVPSGTTRADHKPNHKGGGNGGEVGQVIDVCIAFDDAAGDRVGSDDGTQYCDGGKITAGVGRNRSIEFEGNNGRKANAGRTLFLDLSAPVAGAAGSCSGIQVDVSPSSASQPFGDGICDDCVSTAPLLPPVRLGVPDALFGFPDNVRLQVYGMDLDDLRAADSPFLTNARLIFSVGQESWTLHWGPFKNPGGASYCPESDPISVSRSSTNEADDTWIVETTGLHRACLYRNVKNSDPEYHGQFEVPFGAVAVAIPGEFVGVPDGSTALVEGDVTVDGCVP